MLSIVTCLLAGSLSMAQAKAPEAITDHKLYADDGDTREYDGRVSFAVVGNTREPIPGLDQRAGRRGESAGVTEVLVADMVSQVEAGGPEFLVLTGDIVRTGASSEYNGWSRRFRKLADGGPAPSEDAKRLAVVPVAGDREAAGDKRYENFMGAFPEVGAEIGYNRVGSWYSFDVVSKGDTWRFLVLDTGKKRLGSRWSEQLNWVGRATKGDYDSLVVLMHDGLYDLSGRDLQMNRDNGPRELIDKVEETASDLTALRAVFFAGGHANQVLMPEGPFGALYVGAGGGGAPGEDLKRWGPGEPAGLKEDLSLETMFDLALLGALSKWNDRMEDGVRDVVLNQARAQGSYEGFTGTFNGGAFPSYGWWQVDLEGEAIALNFRMLMPDGKMAFLYRASWTDDDGWKAMKF